MAWLRRAVTNLLNEKLAARGEIGNGRSRHRITRPTESDDADYVIRRLKRDDEKLARRVIAGEVSAHAAAVASTNVDVALPAVAASSGRAVGLGRLSNILDIAGKAVSPRPTTRAADKY